MARLAKRLLGTMGLLLVGAAVQAQEGTLLRYQPTGDAPLTYRKSSTIKQNQEVMDKKVKTEISGQEISQWTITKGEQGKLVVKTENKQLKTKLAIGPLGDYSFDSTKDDNEKGSALGGALTPLYERMSGATLQYTITPLGKVEAISGYKELVGDLLKDNPLAAQFAGGGSDAAAKLSLAEILPVLSKEKVKAGDRWESAYEVNLEKLGKVVGKRIYVCEGEDKVGGRKTVKITTATELSFDLNIDMGAAKVTGMVSISNSKGTIHFDAEKGHPVSVVNRYTLSGNMNVNAGGQDIPVTMEQEQEVRMELVTGKKQ